MSGKSIFNGVPLVTMVIPAYNCESTIAAAVESCLDQRYRSLKVLVVNDGSTDGTRRVLATFGDRIEIVDKANGGLASARNVAHERVTGDYVAWMDGDDIAHPDRVALQVQALESEPGAVLCSSDFSAFSGSGDSMRDIASTYIGRYYAVLDRIGGVNAVYPRVIAAGKERSETAPDVAMRVGPVRERLLLSNFVHPPTVMLRRSVLQRVGEFDETLRTGSDYDFILRVSRYGDFAYIDAPLLRYRISARQLSSKYGNGLTMIENFTILEKIGRSDPEFYSQHESTFRRRFAESLLLAARDYAETDRAKAIGLVQQSMQYRWMARDVISVSARILTPQFAIDIARQLKARNSAQVIAGSATHS